MNPYNHPIIKQIKQCTKLDPAIAKQAIQEIIRMINHPEYLDKLRGKPEDIGLDEYNYCQ